MSEIENPDIEKIWREIYCLKERCVHIEQQINEIYVLISEFINKYSTFKETKEEPNNS